MAMNKKKIIHDLEALRQGFLNNMDAEPICLGEAIKALKEAQPVGRWEKVISHHGNPPTLDVRYLCSTCERLSAEPTDYCPRCGSCNKEELP